MGEYVTEAEKIQGLMKERDVMQAEISRLKADLGVLRGDLALRTQEISRLKQALQDSTTVRNEFLSRFEKASAEVARLTQERDRYKAMYESIA